jgi:hypothetical protein
MKAELQRQRTELKDNDPLSVPADQKQGGGKGAKVE